MLNAHLPLAYVAASAAFLGLLMPAFSQELKYPQTRKADQVDDYHGVKVADPYRWLEDDRSAETAAWVEAQNKVTFGYLEKIPFRPQVEKRVKQLYNYPKYGAPFRKGENFVFSKNDGLQNQSVIYIQKGLDGTPEVLLDPNKFSADGTVRLGSLELSKDGKYCAYTLSKGGSDWVEAYVLEVATKKVLADHIQWIKFSGAAWFGEGFFYSRYPEPKGGHDLSSKNEYQSVYYHRLGAPQASDELIYEDKTHALRYHFVGTTEDERFAYLIVSDPSTGKKGNALFFRDLSKSQKTWTPIVPEAGDDEYGLIDSVGNKFLVQTNHKAPNKKVVLFDPASPASPWSEVVPEKPEAMEGASAAGGKLFVTYLKDVTTRADVYSLTGKLQNTIQLPGLGSAVGFGGNRDDKFVFYTFTSLDYPPTIFRYDIATQKSSMFRAPEIPGFKPGDYEEERVFYTSKDGTKIPMFLIHRKGLKLDGTNPTLLYAYGGFNITVSPAFSPLRIALLEQGFVYATANLRGGGEYGEKWHDAGTKLHKQNVFDDFIAAAEWLVANKYTSPEHLAVNGGSNGGLLIGAVINQRPELFRAAVPQVGVMDMLRFHKFTIGSGWISDYGSSDDAEQFKAIYAYSPLHNVRAGVKYPATFITTADHDDRVVPAHSFKYAATLQEKASHATPLLIRIDTKSGHGASSTTKQLETTADIYSFLFDSLGVTPKF
jgi:prolyl oligopeptidase